MALITSNCDAMRSPAHQMALITSDCDAMRSPEHQMALITSALSCFDSQALGRSAGTSTTTDGSRCRRNMQVAAGETAIPLHPPSPSSRLFPTGMERGVSAK